jgi:hypothetical protein
MPRSSARPARGATRSRHRADHRVTQVRTTLRAAKDALVAFADVAKRLTLRWYVFGAQAVNLHGYPRTTADLDLTIDLGRLTPGALIAELAMLEQALDQSDLVPLYRRLRGEAACG